MIQRYTHHSRSDKVRQSFDVAFTFIKGMGEGLANLVFLFVVGVTFATAMDKVGGVYLIASWIARIGNNSLLSCPH